MISAAVRPPEARKNRSKPFRPLLFHAHCQRERQVLLKQLWCLVRRVPEIHFFFFCDFHIFPKAADLIEQMAAETGGPPHDDREDHQDQHHYDNGHDHHERRPRTNPQCKQRCSDSDKQCRQVEHAVRFEITILVVLLQRAFMRRARTAEQFMILVVENDDIAIFEQRVVQFSFASGKWYGTVAGIYAQQGMIVVVLGDSQVTFDSQADDRGRERGIVVIHLFDVAKRRWRKTLGWFIPRENHTRFRILAVVAPYGNVITEHCQKPGQCNEQVQVICQQPPRFLHDTRFVNKTFWPGNRNRQSFIDAKHPGGFK